ncbi:MAG: tetratricopeptide repeat protein [Syntrophaceae bacterium]|nr:tetratricopeptide repeat protein [Syntrophaceae bacterium]
MVAFWQARSRPYLLVGWLWFIGTLVPVIGIVQVGAQAMADRYTYIPLIGLFMGISWMVQTVTARNTWPKRSAFVAVVALYRLRSLTRMQVGTWKNSFTLYQHALEVVPENPVALNNLGVLCLEAGILEKAVSFFRKAVDLALIIKTHGSIWVRPRFEPKIWMKRIVACYKQVGSTCIIRI